MILTDIDDEEAWPRALASRRASFLCVCSVYLLFICVILICLSIHLLRLSLLRLSFLRRPYVYSLCILSMYILYRRHGPRRSPRGETIIKHTTKKRKEKEVKELGRRTELKVDVMYYR